MEDAMDTAPHNLSTLFQQLGLAHDASAIEDFIAAHLPLPEEVELAEAPFWSKSQADFIRRAWEEDADWAETIDELNVRLRARHH